MTVDKVFYSTLFKNLLTDPIEVEYWDGSSEIFGDGEVKFRIKMHEPVSKSDLIRDPSMAFGEAYMNGHIEIEGNLQDLIESIYLNQESFLRNGKKYARLIRAYRNSARNSRENIEYHYDIGNDFYKLWLDPSMTYSCGYFMTEEDSLEKAQQNKIEHILRKLDLKKGETLLDIGCGWGNLILTAAKEYGVKATGITLSAEQLAWVLRRVHEEKLDDFVDVRLADYRELEDMTFDKIVSVGMLEHVGEKNLGDYFQEIDRLLKEKGISLLHCITGKTGGTNTWINKYIFPGGYIPAIADLISNMSAHNFDVLDVENLRLHYVKTLEHWALNFERALPEIRKMKDETFIRMWWLYLNSCAASFKSGNIDIHQFVFTKGVNNELQLTREYMYR